MHFKLQHLSVHRSTDGQPLQLGFGRLQLRVRLSQLRFGLLRGEALLHEGVACRDAFGCERFDLSEIVSRFGELDLRDLNGRAAGVYVCTRRAVINGEQRSARLHVAADLDENPGDDPGDMGAGRNVFCAGFDEPGAGDRRCIGRLRRL